MIRWNAPLLAAVALVAAGTASSADIEVMTQNPVSYTHLTLPTTILV